MQRSSAPDLKWAAAAGLTALFALAHFQFISSQSAIDHQEDGRHLIAQPRGIHSEADLFVKYLGYLHNHSDVRRALIVTSHVMWYNYHCN